MSSLRLSVARRRGCVAAAALTLALSSTRAPAQPSPGAPAAAEAARLVEHGVELRRQRKEGEALAEFRKAFALHPTPRARAQIALAEQSLHMWLEAEVDLAAALAEVGDPWVASNRAPLVQAQELVKRHLASLTVETNAPRGELRVDGARSIALPLAGPVRVIAGHVALEVHAEGFDAATRTIDLAPGATATERFDLAKHAMPAPAASLAPAAPAPAAPTTVPPTEEDPGRGRRTLAYVVGAAGVVALGVGGWQGVVAIGKKSDRDAACRDWPACAANTDGVTVADAADRDGRSAATVATVAIGLGAAATVTAVVLLLTAPKGGATAARVLPARGGAALTVSF